MFVIDDLTPFFAWWGVAVAAAGVAWLGPRHHLLPRWIGAVSAIAFLLPTAFLTITGLTGFAGVPGPFALFEHGTRIYAPSRGESATGWCRRTVTATGPRWPLA